MTVTTHVVSVEEMMCVTMLPVFVQMVVNTIGQDPDVTVGSE